MEVGFLEVFPPRAAASRPPVLLQTLEAELLEASNSASRLASAGPHQQRDPKLAANLALDVHRQVFKTFIEGFGEAYQPLLTEIQQAFDASIQQGLHDALENSTLRQQLLAAGREQAAAEAQATAEVIQGGQQQRQELYDAVAAAQIRLEAARHRRGLATRDLTRVKTELQRLEASTKASKAAKQRLTDAARAEANWVAARPHASTLLAIAAGPLTPEEDEELEAEMGVVLGSSAPKHPLELALQLLEKHDAASAAKLLENHMGAGTSRRRQLAVNLHGLHKQLEDPQQRDQQWEACLQQEQQRQVQEQQQQVQEQEQEQGQEQQQQHAYTAPACTDQQEQQQQQQQEED